jgi:TPR repeat protein
LVKLGDYYYSGYHVGKDLTKAKMCYEKAANKGNSQGFINLGLLYQKGLVDLDNKVEEKQIAINYFLEAAKLGNANALLFLNKEGVGQEQMKQAA